MHRRIASNSSGQPAVVPALDLEPLKPGFWTAIFGNDHPVSLEIGPGRGETLIRESRAERERNFFAIERSRSSALSLDKRIGALWHRSQ